MKNLTTQKFVFGLLMACVLAFSVQGTVEAQTVSVTGDNAVTSASSGITVISAAPGTGGTPSFTRSFTIRVSNVYNGSSITITSPTAFPATLSGFSGTPTAVTLTEVEVTSAPTETDADANSQDPTPVRGVIAGAAFGTAINFANLGDLAGGGEDPDGTGTRGSWTFKVTYTVSAWGPYVVDVDSAGPSSGNTTAPTVTGVPIAAYVLQSKGRAASYEIDKATATDITQTPQTSGGNIAVQVTDGTNDQGWVQVDLRITSGKLYPTGQFLSGSRVYPLNAANDSGYTSLSVFTAATNGSISVRVNPDRDRTATVTAQISGVTGAHASHTVTYFYNAVTIERVSGNYQHAKGGDRLPQPLVVRVLDGTRPVRDQRVRFTASGGQLRSVTSSNFIRETGSAEGTTAISIKTDSSGQAKVYLTTPAAAALVTVNAEVAPTPPAVAGTATAASTNALASLSANGETFSVFAVERNSTVLSALTIDPATSTSTPIENADPDQNPIYVTVHSGGSAINFPAEVRFTITGGQLYLSPSYLDLDANSLRQSTDRPQYVTQLSLSTNASGQIGTSAAPILFVKVNSGIAVVRAEVVRSSQDAAVRTIQYVAGSIRLETVSNNPRIRGALGGLRSDPFVVRATIGGSPAPGQIVKFTHTPVSSSALVPVPGTKVYVTDGDRFTLDSNAGSIPLATSVPVTVLREETYTVGTAGSPGEPIFVETDSDGEAQVYLQMGTAEGAHTITATLPVGSETESFTVEPQAGTIAGELKKIDVPDLRPNDDNIDTLAIRAINLYGDRLPAVNIRFTTTYGTIIHVSSRGTLTDNANTIPAPAGTANTGQEIFVQTDAYGEVWVLYRKNQNISSGQTVRAEIASEQGSQQYDFEIRHQTFNIGAGSSTTNNNNQNNNQQTRSATLTFDRSRLTGSPGQRATFRVTATDEDGRPQSVPVTLRSTVSIPTLPSVVSAGQLVDITLPNTSTSITASATNYGTRSISVTVQPVPASIEKVSGDNPIQEGNPGDALSSPFIVRVLDRNNNPVGGQTVTFRVTGGGGSVSPTTDTTAVSDGRAGTTLRLGNAGGTNTVEASVSGVSTTVTFTATATEALKELVIYSGDGQEVLPNRRLSEPLVVQVLDGNDQPVRGVYVTFELTSGSGRVLTQRSRTDAAGNAEGEFVPSATGTALIEASIANLTPVTFTVYVGGGPDAVIKVSGDQQSGPPGSTLGAPFVVEVIDEDDAPVAGISVTFQVVSGGGTLSARSSRTNSNGRAQIVLTLGTQIGDNVVEARVAGLTDRVTFRARTGAQIVMDAADRAPLYWINGTNASLHRLVDDEIEDIAPRLEGVTSIAVDAANGYLYLGVQASGNKGEVRRASLNGQNVQTLRTGIRTPTSIAIAGGTLYWTTSNGRIKSMPATGSDRTPNLQQDLDDPTGIAVSNGYVYWAEPLGRIRRVSLTQDNAKVENIATGLGEPTSTAIARGKIYWIEVDSGGTGRLQRADLDGANIEELKVFQGIVPTGMTIDSLDRKIYWTKADKIQRSNLAGKFVKDVATGLTNLGSIAVGTAAGPNTPIAQGNNQQSNNQQANNQQSNNQQSNNRQTGTSKYDVNEDGAVDQADVDQVILAVAFKSGDMKYDLNGDGTVNANDITAIVAAVSSGDAAAPTLADIDVERLDVDVLHEQIALLLASGDRSIAAQRTLVYLQHLLALARPDETVLLANYPNPFNPETWIPYHLANSTDVRINIYDAQGKLVRGLTLGHQTAGYYTSRSRAAYWDGRNAFGEQVASGIYFYQLLTDEMSSMRKMVILK